MYNTNVLLCYNFFQICSVCWLNWIIEFCIFYRKLLRRNVYLLVFFFFLVPLNFSFIWRRHHSRWRAANIDHCSALMAIEQWGFFNVQRQLWHGTSVYNGHLRGTVTLTPIAEHLAVKLSLPVLRLRSIATGIRTPIPPLAVQCSYIC